MEENETVNQHNIQLNDKFVFFFSSIIYFLGLFLYCQSQTNIHTVL